MSQLFVSVLDQIFDHLMLYKLQEHKCFGRHKVWTFSRCLLVSPCSVWEESDGHGDVRAALRASHGADPGAEVRGVHQRARPAGGGHLQAPGSGQRCQTVQRRLRRRREALVPQVTHH